MPFNVLLLPLLGGYVFITNWNRTRFSTKRYSGERLIFHAAIAGVAFLIVAFAVTRSVMLWKPAVFTWWRGIVPFNYTGTSLLAFLLGVTAWWPLNRWKHKHEEEAKKAVHGWNDYLEILLDDALRGTRQVALTLKGRKIYVGLVVRVFDPAYDRKYIALFPLVSGYRESESLNVVFDTNYARTYREMIQPETGRYALQGFQSDFEIIIAVAEIQSASLFDWEAYGIFKKASPLTAAPS